MAAGMDDFLTKPLAIQALDSATKRWRLAALAANVWNRVPRPTLQD